MTHKAFIKAMGANVTQHDGSVNRINFDEPKLKQIASGSEEFCQESLSRYQAKYPETEGGVIETAERGDPWHNDWSKVHNPRDASIGGSPPTNLQQVNSGEL